MKRTLVAIICFCSLATVGYSNASRRDIAAPGQQDKKEAPSYDIYVGQYQVQEGFFLTVTNENGKLMGQVTDDEKAEFKAEDAPDQFFSTVVNARLKFVKDEAGTVIGVVVTIDGKDFPSKKIK